MRYKLQSYAIHELGQRQNQEDSLFPALGENKPEDRLFILCDGMGGHDKGEVASAAVCEVISQMLLDGSDLEGPFSDDQFQTALTAAYDALDARDNGEEKKMGTTMTFLKLHADGATVAHIGDSRIYQLRPAKGEEPARIVFKTWDHSLVNDLIRVGELTEEEAKDFPQKNVITRAMQPCQERRAKADIAHLTDIQTGDYFFMCSDGMLEVTEDENLLFVITNPNRSDEEKIEMLRTITAENKDNHTAHLIHIYNVYQDKHEEVKLEHGPQDIRVELVEDEKQPSAKTPWYLNRRIIILAVVVLAVLAIAQAVTSFFSSSKKEDKADTIRKTVIHLRQTINMPDVSDTDGEEQAAESETNDTVNTTEE